MQRFCVSRDQSCLVTVHVTLHGVGWGGVGHVNVRWNLHMTLMLRDKPSLELAQAEWHETKPCFFDEEILVSLRRNDHLKIKTPGRSSGPCWCLLELRQRLGSQLGSARATNWVST